MAVKIGHASIDERGKIAGGKRGDQTGREICTRGWYSKPWGYYIEPKDEELGERAAALLEQIANNAAFGYSQTARWTGHDSIVANGGKVEGARGDYDCSSLIASVYALAGVKLANLKGLYTGNMRAAFKATGQFNIYSGAEYVKTDKRAKRGGFYLNEGSHVVMALENGADANKAPAETTTTTTGGTKTVKIEMPVIKKGAKGAEVKTLQRLLNALGYYGRNGLKLDVDGSAGGNTIYAVQQFQKARGLEVDGSVGAKTWGALLK